MHTGILVCLDGRIDACLSNAFGEIFQFHMHLPIQPNIAIIRQKLRKLLVADLPKSTLTCSLPCVTLEVSSFNCSKVSMDIVSKVLTDDLRSKFKTHRRE
jgi:hypothetical protein